VLRAQLPKETREAVHEALTLLDEGTVARISAVSRRGGSGVKQSDVCYSNVARSRRPGPTVGASNAQPYRSTASEEYVTMAEPIVLVAGNDILQGTGGHPGYVRAHAWAAQRAGFEPHVFSLSRSRGTVETDFGIVHRIPVRLGLEGWPFLRHRKNQLVWRYAVLAKAVASFVLARRDVHLIHSFGVFGSVGVMARDMLRRHGIEVVPVLSSYDTATREVTAKVHGVSRAHGRIRRLAYKAELVWIRRVVARYEQAGYLGSRLVLVNYESVRRLLAAGYGIDNKIRKLPYSSEAAFRPLSRSPSQPPPALARGPLSDAPLLVAISRHDPRKGVDVLLQALARLRRAKVRCRACLVGGGALLVAHRRLAEQMGLIDITAIVGPVPDSYAYLENADIFVLPSLEEGSGSLSLLEALQAGVAVIASAIDGIPEDVTDGETALLVPPGDAEQLAAAIERLLNDETLREDIAQRGRRTFEARFSCDVFSAALRRAYAELRVTS
jgi:glycosyltransferase involved in cell wall biosynthesis